MLWALARAYESTDMLAAAFATRIDDPDETRSNAPIPPGTVASTPTTSGIMMLSENILIKFTSGSAIDCDVATLTSLLHCRLCDDIFLARYGYHFVVKILNGVHQSATANASTKGVFATRPIDQRRLGFGPLLVYKTQLPRRDRELLQLCRLAHSCLVALHRSIPSAVESMIPRTRSKVLCLLLDQDNVVLLHHVLLCIVVHLKARPSKCTELVESPTVDTIMSFALAATQPPALRATAFTCLRLMLLDAKCLTKPFGLLEKLFDARRQLVTSLQDAHFEVQKQALILTVDFVFRLASEHLVQDVAAVFAESPANRAMLAALFTTLSAQSAENQESGYVLQLLVRLVVRLDLVALTDPDLLVGAICTTLTQQTDSTFLRPLLCNCLFQVAADAKHDRVFARVSRLGILIDLLDERLTLSELQSVGGLLVALATRHEGIRQYLQQSVSGCINKVSRVLETFFKVAVDGVAEAWEPAGTSDVIFRDLSDADGSSAGQESRFIVKMTTGRRVFISHYTDGIYEQVRRSCVC